jgi:hypothetical protein
LHVPVPRTGRQKLRVCNLVDEAFAAGEPFQRDRSLGPLSIGSEVSALSVVVSGTSR